MLEEMFNLAVALVSVAITLLDPMLQLANGVVIYILSLFSFHKKIDTGGPLHGGGAQLPSDGDVSSDGGKRNVDLLRSSTTARVLPLLPKWTCACSSK